MMKAVAAYLSAKAELDRVLRDPDPHVQARALHSFQDACRDLRQAILRVAASELRGAHPQDLEDIAQIVLTKCVERDQPSRITHWLRVEMVRAACPLDQEAGRQVLQLERMGRQDDCTARIDARSALASTIRGACPRLSPDQVESILGRIEQRPERDMPLTPAHVTMWLRRQIGQEVAGSSEGSAGTLDQLGELLVEAERACAGHVDQDPHHRMAALVRSYLKCFFEEDDVPDTVLSRALAVLKERNHPNRVSGWLRTVIRTTARDTTRHGRRWVRATEDADIDDDERGEVVVEPRVGPAERTEAADEFRALESARERACLMIRERYPRFQIDRCRQAFELWLSGDSTQSIATAMGERLGTTVQRATIDQWVSRYRAKLLTIGADLPTEEQELIVADVRASYRNDSGKRDVRMRRDLRPSRSDQDRDGY